MAKKSSSTATRNRPTKEQMVQRHLLAVRLCIAGNYSVAEGFRFYESIRDTRLSPSSADTGADRYGLMQYEAWRVAVKHVADTVGRDAAEWTAEARTGESLEKLNALLRAAMERKRYLKVRLEKATAAGHLEEWVAKDDPDVRAAAAVMALRMELLGQRSDTTVIGEQNNQTNINAILGELSPDELALFESKSRTPPDTLDVSHKPGAGGGGRLMYAGETNTDDLESALVQDGAFMDSELANEHGENADPFPGSDSAVCVLCKEPHPLSSMHVSGACAECMATF